MEFVVWLIATVLVIIPMLKLLPHFGLNKYWSLVCIVPLGLLVLLWIMAMKLQELDQR